MLNVKVHYLENMATQESSSVYNTDNHFFEYKVLQEEAFSTH